MTRQRHISVASWLVAAALAATILLTALTHSHQHCFVQSGAASVPACVYCSGTLAPVAVDVPLVTPVAVIDPAPEREPRVPEERARHTHQARGPPRLLRMIV